MKVVFFSKGDSDVVSSRYRCFYFAEALEENGIETRICSPPPGRFNRRRPAESLRELVRLGRELGRVGRGDVAYLQRPMNNHFVALAAAWKVLFRRPMVFDFCDPIFTHSPRKTRLLTRLADTVVVSCEDLATWARKHSDNVEIVPNSIKSFPPPHEDRGAAGDHRVVIGWAGSAKDHKDNLRLLFPVLARLPAGYIFRLIGARGADDLVAELEALDVPVDAVDWVPPEQAATELARLDVALLPARDILWNRKLMTKLIDYMAAGVPVVASPVGENRIAISDGENGFLASSPDEWVEKLERLLADAGLRRRLGAAARSTIRERYSLPESGKRLAAILRQTAGAGSRGA